MPMGKECSGVSVVHLRGLKVAFFSGLQVAESNLQKLEKVAKSQKAAALQLAKVGKKVGKKSKSNLQKLPKS